MLTKMFIEKFGGEVLIDDDHPLALAQREQEAKATAGSGGDQLNRQRMNVAQLTALCESRGIEVPEGSSKKEMIALLDAAE